MAELVQFLTLQEKTRQTEKEERAERRLVEAAEKLTKDRERAERRALDAEERAEQRREDKEIREKKEREDRATRDHQEKAEATRRVEEREIREHKERVEERRRADEREVRQETERRRIIDKEETMEREGRDKTERDDRRLEDREEARKMQQAMTDTLHDQQLGRERALVVAQGRRLKMGTDIPNLPKLGDPRGIELFLEQFKKDMITFDVPPRQWTTNLRPLLDEKSMEFSRHLPQVTQEDFALLATELTRLHGITPEFHGRTWRNLTQGLDEDMIQWHVKLDFSLKAWMRDCPDRESVMERILMERLLNSMDPETQRWTRNTRPKTGAEAAETANLFQHSARPAPLNQFRPMGPRAPPTQRNDTPLPTRPTNERRGGERRNSSRLPEWDPVKGPRCFECNEYGHIAVACPTKTINAGKKPPPTWKIKEEPGTSKPTIALLAIRSDYSSPTDLSSMDDNAIRGTLNGQAVQNMKRDTGASISFVDENVLGPDYVPGEPIQVTTVQGVASYPTTLVRVEVNGHRFCLKMAISSGFHYDALLGTDIPNLKELLRYPGRKQPQRRCKTRPQPPTEEESSDEEMIEIPRTNPRRQLPLITGPSRRKPPHSTPTPPTGNGQARGLTRDSDQTSSSEHEEPASTEEEPDVNPTDEESAISEEEAASQPLWGGREQLQREQERDPTLKAARRTAGLDTSPFYHLRGVLYRAGASMPDGTRTQQVVLPQKYREEALRMAHKAPLAGHFGRTKTLGRVVRLFFWPGVSISVKDICQQCPTCQVTAPRKSAKAPLVPLPVIRRPFERIAMDMVGPLPATSEGYKYILTVCDYGTRYPEAFPLKSTTSQDVVEALVEMFARTGIPEEILTDRGSNFVSELTQGFHKMLGIRSIVTSAYHPQTDGMVERFNGTLKAGIRKFLTDHGGEWDKALPFLLFAYRETPHSSTGFSPFELLFGRTPKGPLDVLRREWTGDSNNSNEDVVTYLTKMYARMEQASQMATEMEEAAKEDMAAYYDRGARLISYQVGDLVLVLKPSIGSKLQARWKGPFTITRKLSSTTYHVKKDREAKRSFTYHINMLQKYNTPDAVCLMTSTPDQEPEEDLPSWEGMTDAPGQPPVDPTLEPSQQAEMEDLIRKYRDVWSLTPGHTKLTEMSIHTGDATPISTPPYSIPHSRKQTALKEVRDMLAAGIIEPSRSPWAAPMLLVQKKDGTLRPVVDYRKLNQVTSPDPYPMPRTEELIERIATATYITTLDLTKGYWQVPMAPESREKTAFVTPFGKYQFRRMPFGLTGAPACFQRMMDGLFEEVENTAVYIDDLAIHSTTWEEHLADVESALKAIQAAELTIKPPKCRMGFRECAFLGHKVGGGRVRPGTLKVQAIRDFEIPIKKKDVRSFLGLASYYRRFVPQFSTIATPLSDLTKNDQPDRVKWTPTTNKAFETLKASLTKEPVLRGPDFERPFVLQTDASDVGIGAVLSQVWEDDDQPVAYFSYQENAIGPPWTGSAWPSWRELNTSRFI